MKKLFALMLALMLALGGITLASAEEAAAPETVEAVPATAAGASGTINLKVRLNPEVIAALSGAAGEDAGKQVAAIVELINSLNIALTSDGKDAEMVISVKDTPVAGLGVIKSGDKMLVVSDLFPKYALAIDSKDMGSMVNGVSGNIPGASAFTMPQISMTNEQAAALAAPLAKVMEDLKARVGEPQAVEETMYGAAFTVKTPVNLSTKELLQMVLSAVKEVASQESFTSVIEQLKAQGMKVNYSPEEIDKAIEELNEKKDEDLPALDAAIFSNEAGDSIVMIRLTKDAEAVDVKAGTVAGGFVTEVTALDKVHLLIQGAGQGMTISMQLEPQEGMKLDIDGDIQATGENFTAAFDVKINGAALGSLTIDGASGGALTGSYTAEGRTEISIADLQNQQSEKAQEFMSNLQVGAMIVMGKIAQALPSFAELLQQMSAPQSAPAD